MKSQDINDGSQSQKTAPTQTPCKCENCKCGERRVAEVKANAEFMAGFGQALREHLSDTRPTPFADIKRV